MCLQENGNRLHSCYVGELTPGTQFRTPEGDTLLVTDAPAKLGLVTTVNLQTGALTTTPDSTRLGHDKRDRLYASRYLNPVPDVAVDEEMVDLSQPVKAACYPPPVDPDDDDVEDDEYDEEEEEKESEIDREFGGEG